MQKSFKRHPMRRYQLAAFLVGIGMLALVVFSPINTIARTQLVAVHFAQMVIVTSICAPLLLFACSAELLRPLLKIPIISSLLRFLTFPVVASIIFNSLFLLWHVPKIYNAIQANPLFYQVMVLGIFFASLLNWWPLLGSLSELRPMSYPVQILYAFFDGQPVDIFALILVFSGVPFYTHYAIPAQLGLSRFADQAIGGALLLIPGLIDLAVMSPLFFRWLAQIEAKTRLEDQKRLQHVAIEQTSVDSIPHGA